MNYARPTITALLQYKSSSTNMKNDEINHTVERMINECKSVREVAEFVYDNWLIFHQRGKLHLPSSLAYKVSVQPQLELFSFVSVFFGRMQTYHFAPFGKQAGKELTNINCPITESCLGYTGLIKVKLSSDPGFRLQDVFRGTALKIGPSLSNTACMPGQGIEMQFIASLFLDDWPGLANQALEDRLTGNNRMINRYYSQNNEND